MNDPSSRDPTQGTGTPTGDCELLRRYVEKCDEAAFAELVQRHLALVFGAALRQLDGVSHRAEDVTQSVITDFARKAGSLARRDDIAGWLYTSTHFAAAKLKRTEQRRQLREQEAHIMHELLSESQPGADWVRLRPVLDDAMHELSDGDRAVILQRFFQGRRFAEVGEKLGLSQDAARMRVDRALEKLRALLARRQITSTTAALAIVLANQPVVAVPASLAVNVTSSALASAAAAAGPAVSIFQFMSTSKTAVVVAVLVAVTAVGTAVVEIKAEYTAEAVNVGAGKETQRLSARVAELKRSLEAERQAAAESQPVRIVVWPPVAGSNATALDEEESGQQFLATHPDARKILDEVARDLFERRWGARLRALNLPASERDALVQEMMRVGNWTFRITENGWSFGPAGDSRSSFDASERRLRELLGPERAAQYDEQIALTPVHDLLRAVAGASYDAAAPLTADQTNLVIQTIMSNGGRRVRTTEGSPWTDINRVDWPAVSRSLSTMLAPAQLSALEAAAANEAAKLNERRAGQQFLVPVGTPASGGGG